MSNVLTDWRVALEALILTTFPTATKQSGDRTGRVVNNDRYSVHISALVADADVNDARPRAVVRYWKAKPKVGANLASAPPDPAPLEQLIVDLAAMFKAKITTLGVSTLAYFHVESITPDYDDEYGVECVLVGWMRNPMETGG
jgi:hypothetical protein